MISVYGIALYMLALGFIIDSATKLFHFSGQQPHCFQVSKTPLIHFNSF